MQQEQIIPTRHKSKIPQTLSYPIGAKAISEALIGVPQFDDLTVEFWFWKQFARHHGTATPYRVMEVQFSGPVRFLSASKNIEDSNYNRPRWTIIVDAVPRPLRHLIQGKLTTDALPLIGSWLRSNAHSMEREGGHRLVFSFDELKIELTHDEGASIEWHTTKVNRGS